MKVISFMNQKGGVGKTTTTFHFASYQAKKGKKVLCIDLDPQGSLSFCMGAKTDGENTIYELLMGEATFSETVQQGNYCDIIPADTSLGILSGNIESKEDKLTLLKKRLGSSINAYDYVLIDCPPGITLYNLNALSISDNVVIITQAEALSLLGLPQVFELINNGERFYSKSINIAGILITMYNGRLLLSMQVIAELERHYADKLFSTQISRNVKLTEAPGFGRPVYYHDKRSKGAEEYLAVAKELMQRI